MAKPYAKLRAQMSLEAQRQAEDKARALLETLLDETGNNPYPTMAITVGIDDWRNRLGRSPVVPPREADDA